MSTSRPLIASAFFNYARNEPEKKYSSIPEHNTPARLSPENNPNLSNPNTGIRLIGTTSESDFDGFQRLAKVVHEEMETAAKELAVLNFDSLKRSTEVLFSDNESSVADDSDSDTSLQSSRGVDETDFQEHSSSKSNLPGSTVDVGLSALRHKRSAAQEIIEQLHEKFGEEDVQRVDASNTNTTETTDTRPEEVQGNISEIQSAEITETPTSVQHSMNICSESLSTKTILEEEEEITLNTRKRIQTLRTSTNPLVTNGLSIESEVEVHLRMQRRMVAREELHREGDIDEDPSVEPISDNSERSEQLEASSPDDTADGCEAGAHSLLQHENTEKNVSKHEEELNHHANAKDEDKLQHEQKNPSSSLTVDERCVVRETSVRCSADDKEVNHKLPEDDKMTVMLDTIEIAQESALENMQEYQLSPPPPPEQAEELLALIVKSFQEPSATRECDNGPVFQPILETKESDNDISDSEWEN